MCLSQTRKRHGKTVHDCRDCPLWSRKYRDCGEKVFTSARSEKIVANWAKNHAERKDYEKNVSGTGR